MDTNKLNTIIGFMSLDLKEVIEEAHRANMSCLNLHLLEEHLKVLKDEIVPKEKFKNET